MDFTQEKSLLKSLHKISNLKNQLERDLLNVFTFKIKVILQQKGWNPTKEGYFDGFTYPGISGYIIVRLSWERDSSNLFPIYIEFKTGSSTYFRMILKFSLKENKILSDIECHSSVERYISKEARQELFEIEESINLALSQEKQLR